MTLHDLPQEVDDLPILEWIEGQFQAGARMSDIASLLGLTRAQFNELRRTDAGVKLAMNRGLALFHDFLTGRLLEIIKCGNEKNAMTAGFFLLKSRFSYIDTPKADPGEAVINVRLELPKAYGSTTEYEQARLADSELIARPLPESDEAEETS